MFFSLYNSIKMEKASSSSTSDHTIPFDAIIAVLIHTISNWLDTTQSCLSKFQSFLQSQHKCCCNSKVLEDRIFDSLLPKISEENEEDDGSMSREEVKTVMSDLGIVCSNEKGDEQLPETFCSDEILGLFDENEPSLEEVKEAFDVFDENRDGYIDAKELQRVLCSLGLKEGAKVEDCERMIERFDENRDGRIELFEFVKLMEASFC